jgi:LPS export ABC transporter protein LptC
MKKLLLSLVFFSLLIVSADENNEVESIEEPKIELTKPSFSINQKNLKIYMTGEKMKMNQNGIVELTNVLSKFGSESKKSEITADFAFYNKDKEVIGFKDSVNFNFITNKSLAHLKTESLKINLAHKMVKSDSESNLDLNESQIISKGFQYNFNEELEPYLKFIKGEFKDKRDSENYGIADNLKLIDKNKILLEGNALFTQKGLRIEADSIYYDYLEKKIIKSINAKVTST